MEDVEGAANVSAVDTTIPLGGVGGQHVADPVRSRDASVDWAQS